VAGSRNSIRLKGVQVEYEWDHVIYGEPASAKNQRRLVRIGGQPRLIKSKKALDYQKHFLEQAEPLKLDPLIEGDCALIVDVYYASRRPDLACVDLIQDLLQNICYANDRQVKASQSIWNLDKENPRARIRIRKLNLDSSTGLSSFGPFEIWGETTKQE